jgi:hypothetical protein
MISGLSLDSAFQKPRLWTPGIPKAFVTPFFASKSKITAATVRTEPSMFKQYRHFPILLI